MYGHTHNIPFPSHFDLDCTTIGGYDSPGYTGTQLITDCIATPINNNGGFSAGYLQGASTMQHHYRLESPFSNENNIIIESMNKTCCYSPKEKRERIERYRSKKNQRNFNKKIKYVCRKTLADSRPRIQGRFARNDEIERTNNQGGGEEGFNEENVDSWMFNFSDPFSSNLIS
ncbi:hypothetical protein L6452_42664 [Arctium lappa]|uniref:Uncharacterized protein n=1 Tax=Arctium lappa TaxID=4217 RepID=A0ACB8XIW0_ARCLA|nr:hypothetical protein L6452_42664 [Arctium lappa]